MINHSGLPSNVVYLCVEVSSDRLLGPVLVVKFGSPLCLRVTHSVGHHLRREGFKEKHPKPSRLYTFRSLFCEAIQSLINF